MPVHPRLPLTLLAAALLSSACARGFFGTGEPFRPWARPAEGVTVREEGQTLVVEPPPGPTPARTVVFLHGFATAPYQYRLTLEQLAARGFRVVAPTLPDYVLFSLAFHHRVHQAALAAYDEAAQQSAATGASAPLLVGYSMGGGAALLVAVERRAAAVLWAPNPLDQLPQPSRATAPLLIVAGAQDCIVKDKPKALAASLGDSARQTIIPGNHIGFTDMTFGAGFDCEAPVSREAQREDVLERTVAFLRQAP